MKKIISLVCAVCLTLGFVGCGSANKSADNKSKNSAVSETKNSEDKAEESGEVKWTISIEGVGENTIEYTNLDIEKLDVVELDAVQKKKDGSTKEQHWSGPLAKDVFEQIGVTEFSSAVFEAADGYNKEITAELINAEGTILGIKLDGEELSEKYAPAELVINGKGSNWWIRNLKKITIKK